LLLLLLRIELGLDQKRKTNLTDHSNIWPWTAGRNARLRKNLRHCRN